MFSNYSNLNHDDQTVVEFVFLQIPGRPVLKVAPATESHEAYYSDFLEASAKLAPRALQAQKKRNKNMKVARQIISESRDQERELFSRHIVRGWEDVVDDQGEVAEFTQENCLKFLQALPDFLFDDLQEFCKMPSNFMINEGPSNEEIEALAKN